MASDARQLKRSTLALIRKVGHTGDNIKHTQLALEDLYGGLQFVTDVATGVISGISDHGALTGLGDDDHPQYLYLSGRGSSQTAYGGTGATGTLSLESNAAGGSTSARMQLTATPHVIFDITAGSVDPIDIALGLVSGTFLGTSLAMTLTSTGGNPSTMSVSNVGGTNASVLYKAIRIATQTGDLFEFLDSDGATKLSFVDYAGAWNGPIGIATITGNSLIYNDPNTYSGSGVSYSAASKTLTAVGQFGSSVIGQYVFGPDIPVGAVVVSRTNNDVTLDVFPTGTQAAALVFYGFGQFWKHRTLNRFWKLAGDTEADTVTTYSINRTSASYNPVIPTLDYANAFTKGQKITAGAGQYGMNVIPDGTTDAFRSESGGGTAWFRVTYDGRVISTLPDSWAGNGPGTSAITHTVNATSNFNVIWPDTAGYISISPTPTETLNTSSTFGPTTLITTTGATYIRLVAILSVRTAQAGKFASLTFNWNDGVAARSAGIIDLDMSVVTEFQSFETVIVLGAAQSLTNTLSYSVAPTTGKVDVRVIITRIYG